MNTIVQYTNLKYADINHPDLDEFDVKIETGNLGGPVPPTTQCQIQFYFGDVASIPMCGEHDRLPPGPKSLAKDGSNNSLSFPLLSSATYFNDTPFDEALKLSAFATTISDSTAVNDLEAADMYFELLTASLDTVSDSLSIVIEKMQWAALSNYKSVIERLLVDSLILVDANTAGFETVVQKYVDVLMVFTDSVKTPENYERQFMLEINKVSLFNNLMKQQISLEILSNISYCDHNPLQEAILAEQMETMQFVIASQQMSPSQFVLSNMTFSLDSLLYEVPLINVIDSSGFGSYIQSPNSVLYTSCVPASLEIGSNGINDLENASFILFPNPTAAEVFVSTVNGEILDTETPVIFTLYEITGREVFSARLTNTNQKLQLNDLPSALYIYSISSNGESLDQGRIAILR